MPSDTLMTLPALRKLPALRAMGACAFAGMVLLAASMPLAAQPATPALRVAFIDPLSGAFANAGESSLQHFRHVAETINARGAVFADTPREPAARLEIIAFDNRAQTQETLAQLQRVIDQGIRIVVQGQSSAAALALSDAISRHNQRDPARSVLFLNYAAVDPDLTGGRCSFWHFRFDAGADMRMEALVRLLERDAAGAVRAVYLIGQNYSFGQQVSRAARETLARRLPAARIVGDELHPLGQVKDFAPYVAKMRAAGADTVITGNWGNDLALLVRAAREARFDAGFYTFYANSLGAVTAIGEAGVGRVRQANEWHVNAGEPRSEAYALAYRERHGQDFHFFRITTLLDMLQKAVGAARDRTGSAEPIEIAYALEGMRHTTPLGEVRMRAEDHQLLQPLYASTLERVARGTPGAPRHDVEGTGLGFRTVMRLEAEDTARPSVCRMSRPPRP